MKYYIVIFAKGNDVELIKPHIKSTFSKYYFYGNNCILSSPYDSAQKVYEKITTPMSANIELVVFEIDESNYWGFANKNLWNWLKGES